MFKSKQHCILGSKKSFFVVEKKRLFDQNRTTFWAQKRFDGAFEESLDDVDVDEHMMHTEEETRAKEVVWNEHFKNDLESFWHREQERKRRIRDQRIKDAQSEQSLALEYHNGGLSEDGLAGLGSSSSLGGNGGGHREQWWKDDNGGQRRSGKRSLEESRGEGLLESTAGGNSSSSKKKRPKKNRALIGKEKADQENYTDEERAAANALGEIGGGLEIRARCVSRLVQVKKFSWNL